MYVSMVTKHTLKRGQYVVGYLGIKKDVALGIVYNVYPFRPDCFYLTVLIHHVRGPTGLKNR